MDVYTKLKIINVFNKLLSEFTNTCLTSAMCFLMEENLCKMKDISCCNNSKNRNNKNKNSKIQNNG